MPTFREKKCPRWTGSPTTCCNKWSLVELTRVYLISSGRRICLRRPRQSSERQPGRLHHRSTRTNRRRRHARARARASKAANKRGSKNARARTDTHTDTQTHRHTDTHTHTHTHTHIIIIIEVEGRAHVCRQGAARSIPRLDSSAGPLSSIPRLDSSARFLGSNPRHDTSARFIGSIPRLGSWGGGPGTSLVWTARAQDQA